MRKELRRLILGCVWCLLCFGNTLAQSNGQFVIKKRTDNGNTDIHYLAHVYNETTHKWELQDATEFSPDCLWRSDREFNVAGTNRNYYFYDGANYRFLKAPLSSNGRLELSASIPETYILNNPDEDYYFYAWDPEVPGVIDGSGLSRGHQYAEATVSTCQHDWEDDECWEVYWVESKEVNGVYKWEMSDHYHYNITADAARFHAVTVTPHSQVITPVSGGLTALTVPSTMEWSDDPLNPTHQNLSATAGDFTYTFIPAYITYFFHGGTHNYCNSSLLANHGDLGDNVPVAEAGGTHAITAYLWSITGEGQAYLSFAQGSNINTSDAEEPTLYYRVQNTQGHKTARITLTVTFDDDVQWSLSQDVTVKTTCQNPAQALAPVVTYADVTVSWYPTASQYKLEWTTADDTGWTSAHSVELTGTTYSITGLEYGTEYKYRVTAFCNDAYLPSPSGSTGTFTTGTRPNLIGSGAVFGGGRMANVGGNTEVVIINCDGIGAVYGGNDIAGAVSGDVGSTITLGVNTSDTYATSYNEGHASNNVKVGDVYGGGNGYYAYNGTSFMPASNSYSSQSVAANGGHVNAMTQSHTVGEAVWTNNTENATTLTFPTIKKTSITVTNNTVTADSIFGGAKNAFITNTNANVNGTFISIHGGTVFAVFGGNNFGGTQTAGKHRVEVIGTSIPDPISSYNSSELGRDFGVGYVFGGGNKVPGLITDVLITGGMCDTVFAGGNAASVAEAKVQVNCSFTAGNSTYNPVFGETYTNAVVSYDGTNPPIIKDTNDYAWNGTGIYNVRTLFGGNNKATMSIVPTVTLTSGSVGTVYGGGNAGDMTAADETLGSQVAADFDKPIVTSGGVTTTIGGVTATGPQNIRCSTHVKVNSASMFIDNLYGGCQMSDVEFSTWVEVHQGHVGNVFGGCNISGDVGSLPMIGWFSGIPADQYQYVKGATYVKAVGGTIYKNLFAGSNGYYHCNDGVNYINGIINKGHYIGMTIPTHNETHVKVSGDVHVKGNVYAGGNLAPVGFIEETDQNYTYRDFVGFASVHMLSGTVDGDVFGGGNMASIYGSNEVKIEGGTIHGALYGGNDRCGLVAQITNRVLPSGYDIASDNRISLTAMGVHTYVSITGKPRINTVYGGGNGAYDYTATNFCNPNDQPVQSNTFVDINIDAEGGEGVGGRINTVYGGGNGVTVTGGTTVLVNVKNAGDNSYDQIGTIFGGNNMGDLAILPDVILLSGRVDTLYGGCNSGAMTGSFTVEGYNNVGSRIILRNTYRPVGSTDPITLNGVISGAVYGGCRMNDVTNNTLVLVENGTHTAQLFGGSDISGTVHGNAQVIITGGTVNADVFGGGNGNYIYANNHVYSAVNNALIAEGAITNPITPPHCDTSTVIITGGISNNLYAGSFAGSCGETYLDVLGGTVNGNVFGGGYGASSRTTGDVLVNIGVIDAASADDCPVINGDIYGGSALGSVNDGSSDLTTVNFLNGTLHGNVYGGGLGDPNDDSKGWVNGQVVVNIGSLSQAVANCFIDLSAASVFGCNNTNGSPQDDVTVNIYNTAHNTANSYPNPVPTDPNELLGATTTQFAIQAVYGGGNLADYAPQNGSTSSTKTTLVHVYQCDQNTIKDVYGGSNRASAQNTYVIIDGGRIDRTFGGGNGLYGPAPVVGTARTEIYAGLITQVFGGSNNNGNIGQIELEVYQSTSCPELIYEVFSGSNQAPLYGDVETNLIGDCYDAVTHNVPDGIYYYGGTSLAPIYGNVTLNVYSGYYVNVFAGSKGSLEQDISADIRKFPTIAEVEAHPENYQPDPDGLKAYITAHPTVVGTGGNVTMNIYGGMIENAFGGSDALGDIEGKITVNVEAGGGDPTITHCDLDLTNVYGAGRITPYNPDSDIAAVGSTRLTPEVNIKKGTVLNNVFGGGLGTTATVTANPVVTIGDVSSGHEAYVAIVGRTEGGIDYGNVYGGGELAQVHGNTKVLVQKSNTVVKGTVYGGGKGKNLADLTSTTDPTSPNYHPEADRDAGLVKGNATVQMTGGNIQRSIYGGGELGSVGYFRDYYTANEDPLHVAGEPKSCYKGTGLTKVLISGGRVGMNSEPNGLMPNPDDPTTYDDYGYVFCASKGAVDSISYPTINLLAVVDSTYLEISSSAVVTASVYGGSENGQVLRNTYVKIMGGQIGLGHYKDGGGHHWDPVYSEAAWTTAINKVKNGTFTDADASGFHFCDAWPFKEEDQRFVYDHYAKYKNPSDGLYYYDAAFTQSSNGGANKAGDGHSFFGHVFGGGSGYYPIAPDPDHGRPRPVWRRSAGRVCGNTYVEITGGHILTNVYGGNEITDVLGHSKVEMKGGTLGVPRSLDSIQARPVNCNLFGAGMGDPRIQFNSWANVGSSEVIVKDNAFIFGSVFGGGEDGHVLGDANTTVTGNAVVGTFGSSGVDGNTFGGGRGFSAIALTAGVVCGNVELNVGGNAKILGSIFGGGRLAAVGTYLVNTASDLYGHLQPDVPSIGERHGHIEVNITGGTIGNLTRIDTSKYSIGDVYGGSKGTLLKDISRNQRLGLAKNTTVNISGASTQIYGSVYGGGEIASVGNYHYATKADTTSYNPTHPSEPMTVGDVFSLIEEGTGIAKVIIEGGTIGHLQDTLFAKGHVFGSCLGKSGDKYSGYSYVDSTYVKLNGGTVYSSIFGGGENGHVLHNTNVLVQSGTVGIRMDTVTKLPTGFLFQGNVYGGGRGIDEDPDDNTYCITAGKVSGNTNVTVTGGTIYRNVYGGGSFASVGNPDENPSKGDYTTGLATVTISGGQIGTDGGKTANLFESGTLHRNSLRENGFVFGSGRGLSGNEGSVFDSLAYTNNTSVTIEGTAYVTGSVFGGGENGHVKNNALVTVNADNGASTITESISTGDFTAYPFASSGKEPYPVIGYPLCRADMVEDLEHPRTIFRGNVYGGGRGIDPKDEHGNLSKNAGVVYGNAEVHINGGTVRHNVYGGGSVASVGTLTYDHSHNDSVTGILTGTGRTHVYITGGIIGIDTTLTITQVLESNVLTHNLAGINNGQVYGGGRGRSGEDYKNLAFVDSTHMIISGGVIYGAVFGGGCNGHVKRNTYVQMTGGTIGHTLTPTEKVLDFTHNTAIYFGNVYGGGRGIDHANLPTTICRTSGQVYGDTKVEISGGRVHHNVYGGGSLANVGDEKFDSQGNVIGINSGGYATVTITGTAIIGTDGQNAGHVYGSGRGMAGTLWSDMAYVDKTFVTIGTKNGSDNPQVRGSVFGGGSDGHVEEDTDVKIYTGTIGTKLTAAEMVEIDPDPTNPNPETRPQIYRGNVYGGGRGVERSISGGQIQLDATAGRVFGNTNVLVEGGTIYHNIYGGGSLASVGTFTTDATGNHFTDGTGKATITITNGEIGMSPTNAASVSGATQYFSGLNSGQVYGSGRGEAGTSFANFAFTNVTEVNVSGGNIYGAVFGGGENGHVQTSTQVNISGGSIGFNDGNENQSTYNIYRGNVYGGGRGIDIDTEDPTMIVSPTAGKVYGNTEINITDGTIYHNVYGGGSLASVGTTTGTAPNLTFTANTGQTTINISGGQIGTNSKGNGRVFGAGRGYPHPDLVSLTYVDKTEVNVFNGADIRGCVFGSGDNGQVYTEARVNMSGGTVGTDGGTTDGNLFGSGRGVDTYDDNGTPTLNPMSGLVYGDTHVTMTGGIIKNSAYGGGFMASAGQITGNTLVGGTTHVSIGGSATVGLTGQTIPTGYDGGKVFGGSHGDSSKPDLAKVNHTVVNVSSAEVYVRSNVYGGGENGAVDGNTQVNISNATLHDVFGAGQGDANIAIYTRANANIGGNTTVNINSGTLDNVYGGGQNGTVCYQTETSSTTYPDVVSTVNINGGTITHDVYGGGDQGTTQGQIVVNLKEGIIQNELFGGARGSRGNVYVAGLKTVNTYGGTVFNHVYGGSRNANDGMLLSASTTTTPDANTYTAFVNVCGGLLRGDVYGAGYYGHMFGSSDVNIGRDAIKYANTGNIRKGSDAELVPAYLHIIKSVYAGSNWGEYNPAVPFASSTTTGRSNVYVDGNGYDTEKLSPPPANTYTSTYMEIGGSIYGSGTSSDAGTQGRKVQVANYGHAILAKQTLTSFDGNNQEEFTVLNSSTRQLHSIQRCDTLILDNIDIKFIGQGDISQNYNTVEYAFLYIDKGLYVRNGSNIIANVQIDEVHALYSQYRPDTINTTNDNGLYAAHPVAYWIGIGDSNYGFYYNINGTNATALPNDSLINTIRFNGGYALFVRYNKQYSAGQLNTTPERFGELQGFFRMVTEDNNETFAHARPKVTETNDGNPNRGDGGFMSYYNQYQNTFDELTHAYPGDPYTKGKQFPYENVMQTRSDRPDYRYWRIKATNDANLMVSPMAFFLFSNPSSTDDFITIERTISLPPLECEGNSYYVLSDLDYGDHVHLVDAAIDIPHDNDSVWMVQAGITYNPLCYGPSGPASTEGSYYDIYGRATGDMISHPNTYFGLVLEPGGSLEGDTANHEYLLSMTTREMLSEGEGGNNLNPAKFYYPSNPNGQLAKMTIRLTYYKEMTMSMALSPVTISLKSYCVPDPTHPDDRVLQDIISIPIYITTQTALGQDMTTTSYAMYGDISSGNNPETYNVKATLPPFIPLGVDVPFYVYGVDYAHNNGSGSDIEPNFDTQNTSFAATDYNFAMTFKRGFNSDNKSGWREAINEAQANFFQKPDPSSTEPFTPIRLGSTDGRNPSSIDFTLYYNSCKLEAPRYTENKIIGTLTYHICYPKAAEDVNVIPDTSNATNWAKFAHFDIHIDLFKKEHSTGFYLDGVHGDNTYSGEFANYGKKTLQGIIDNNWAPGDIVWVVRPVSNISTVTWTSNNGAPIVMKRYPGGFVDPDHYDIDTVSTAYDHSFYWNHGLDSPVANTGIYQQDTLNPSVATTEDDGAIFANIKTKSHLVIDNIILDGYNDDTHPQVRPLISVSGGGTVTMRNSCEVRNSKIHPVDALGSDVASLNLADAKGSAVYIGDNGSVILMDGVYIHNNVIPASSGNGAAVYLDSGGTLTVGGLVTIKGNTVNGTANNVYLHVDANSSNINDAINDAVVTIGEDGLDFDSEIWVTKTKFIEDPNSNLKDLTPIATSIYNENIHNAYTYNIFKDDTRKSYTHFFIENTLYYGKTWAHFVTNCDPDHPYDPAHPDVNPEGVESGAFTVDATSGIVTIRSERALAWFLSYVNGLNGSAVHEDAQGVLSVDVNMSEHYWKPVGIVEENGCEHGFTGAFDGQWHTVDGLVIKREGFRNIGFFDNVASDGTNHGVVKNVVLGSKDCHIEPWNPDPVAQYTGGLVGSVMAGGLVTACEAYPVLNAHDATSSTVMGGVAGRVANGGMVHSCIGMPNLTGYTMGGLAGLVEGGGHLVNSYSNIESMACQNDEYSSLIGGLVGKVLTDGFVENCYVRLQSTATESNRFGWFVGQNSGQVKYCYALEGKTNYVFDGTAPTGHGNYAPLPTGNDFSIKAIGYMYDDNKVTLSDVNNPYYNNKITYTDASNQNTGHITGWPGMLSALNHWVTANYDNSDARKHYASWFRPINNMINDDMPVLGLEEYNSVASQGSNRIVLKYGNLDDMLGTLNDAMDSGNNHIESSLLLYGNATGVTHAPLIIGNAKDAHPKVKVTVNEDAVLLLDASAPAFEATVGITFDNSSREAQDYYNNQLDYDWHLMSTPLSNAKIGATYSHQDGSGNYTPDVTHTFQGSPVDIVSLNNSYFPNGLAFNHTTEPYWDFYAYYEPEYHWINLKRNKKNHFHHESIEGQLQNLPFQMDELGGEYRHYQINYTGSDQADNTSGDADRIFTPGKGYMMAISQDSYMNSTGTLNKGDVIIPVTALAPEVIEGITTEGITTDKGSNLVGNPYQAYLDLDEVSTTTINPGLDKFWVYDADVKEGTVKGLYKPYTKGASQNPAIPSRYLHPHQGFFVVYTPGSGESDTKNMTFKYDMATATTNEYSYYRTDDDEQPKYPLVNLYVRDTLGNTDLAIVEFTRPELGGVPKVNNLRNADFKLYARYEDGDYGLLFTPDGAKRVPVFFKTPNNGKYTITWDHYNGTFASMFLVDNITGARCDMLQNDHYVFDALATDYAARFYIVFSLTDVEEFDDDTNDNFAFFNGSGWVVEGQGQLELIDMLGHVLYANNLNGAPTIVYFDDFAAGVYTLRLVDGSRLLKAQKIVIIK